MTTIRISFPKLANNQEVQGPSTSCQNQQHTTNVISKPKDIFSDKHGKNKMTHPGRRLLCRPMSTLKKL